MATDIHLLSRRAIEALRSGVPNRDAVQALGSSQTDIEKRFREQLDGVVQGFRHGMGSAGMLIAGDFGSGKSHLLEYLQHVALQQNFVCSKVVVSKETPLHDPAKVFTAAIQSAVVPGRRGNALVEIARQLDFNSRGYADFFKWVNGKEHGLSNRFPATVFVYERSRAEDINDQIVQFWSGGRIGINTLKQWLSQLGETATYRIDKATVKELAAQRYTFVPRLMVAAGYAGWVILIDEVELIGRYSLRSRAKSYAEVARLLGKLEGSSIPGLTCVLTITTAFESEVLDDPKRNDEERVPNRLRAAGKGTDLLLVSQAERGMRIIRRERLHLMQPSEVILHELYDKVRTLHGQAYQWDPPERFSLDRTERVRGFVRRWIYEWDLMRLYPGYAPDIEGTVLKEDLSERPELEGPEEGMEGNEAASP